MRLFYFLFSCKILGTSFQLEDCFLGMRIIVTFINSSCTLLPQEFLLFFLGQKFMSFLLWHCILGHPHFSKHQNFYHGFLYRILSASHAKLENITKILALLAILLHHIVHLTLFTVTSGEELNLMRERDLCQRFALQKRTLAFGRLSPYLVDNI